MPCVRYIKMALSSDTGRFRLLFKWISFGLSLILVIPAFLPTSILGTARDLQHKVTPLEWINGLGLWLLGSFLLVWFGEKFGLNSPVFLKTAIKKVLSNPLVVGISVLASLLIAVSSYCYNFRPLTIDSVAQLFQAKVFAAGNAVAPAPEYPEFFFAQNMLFESNGVYAQYPPVHSLALSVGVLLGLPHFIAWIISLTGLFAAYLFYKEILTKSEAAYSVLLLSTCSFHIFLSSSLMNHSTEFTLIALGAACITSWLKEPRASKLFGAGLFAGLAVATRPLETLVVYILFALWILYEKYPRFYPTHYFAGFVGLAPGVGLYLFYNHLTTGSAFEPGYLKLWGDTHNLGFHATPWGLAFTWQKGLLNFLINIKLLNEHLLETPWPALLFVPLLFLPFGTANSGNHRLLLLALSAPFIYTFYWHRDSFFGPRFIHVSVLFLIPLIVRAFYYVGSFLTHRIWILGHTSIPLSKVWTVFIVGSLLFAAGFGFPQRFSYYAIALPSFKVELTNFLIQEKVEKALVFIPVSFGHRLVNRLKRAGLSASQLELLYMRGDHCRLYDLVRQFERGEISGPTFHKALLFFQENALPQEERNIAGDPSFKYYPSLMPFSSECQEELEYDRTFGFSVYAPYFADNNVDFKGNYVFATDLREENRKLISSFPEHTVYYYRKGVLSKQ